MGRFICPQKKSRSWRARIARSKVAIEDGLPLRALAERFADRLRAQNGGTVDASVCLARLREVAARLADDGLLHLTADGQRLSLAKRPH
jgi:hypothetical protein